MSVTSERYRLQGLPTLLNGKPDKQVKKCPPIPMSTAEMAQNIFICLSLVTKSLLSRPPSPGYTCRVLRSSFHRSSPPTPPYVCLVCIGYGRSFGAHSVLAELYITAMTLPHICFASLFCFTPLPPFPFRVAVYASGARFVVSREWLKGTILRNS